MPQDNIFNRIAISQVPRIIGFIDCDEQSKTYGCCDRHYWHYKTVDISNARYQEAALTLACAYSLNHLDNPYFHHKDLKSLVSAIGNFWFKRVHHDGSVDESYPQEHHFCATALSLFSLTESLLILDEKSKNDFDRSIKFLSKNNNLKVSNQTAGSAAALYNIYLLTGSDIARLAAEEKIAYLLKQQEKEEFFTEYGGFDLGYNSITLSFLALLFKKTGRDDIKCAAIRAIDYMRPFLDENGYYSPDAMSRNTQFLYPYGLSVFASDVLAQLKQGLERGVVLNPTWLDDRYCIPLTNDYLLSSLYPQEEK
ncbi:hypothetical protein ACFL49_01880 [Candidatus Omnitrophota bacterium]